ncbi:MAG: type I secretion system permease/ATPase [Sterolibacterium sp.]|jgi:ATP-binding cassette subfamily C exporter for protease/lipase|nr:type I secretion system permease/ATPase [Sterolibacterium sp.]
MKNPAFFQRSELTATLWSFRREFIVATIFTAVMNVLMLTPTIYMLQVYDRALVSGSEMTLAAVTLIMVFMFIVIAVSDWSRARLLVRTGVKLDKQLNTRVFNASFEAYLQQQGRNPTQAFNDLTTLRQYLTGQGLFAFLDLPWAPIYIVVLWLLHPSLGIIGALLTLLLVLIAWLSKRYTDAPLEKAAEEGMQVNQYVNSKLRNTQVIEAMGMLDNLRHRWLTRHRRHMATSHHAQDLTTRTQSFSKFFRLSQQSVSLAAGAILVIQGHISAGAMLVINTLMGRATAPIDQLTSSWKQTLEARRAFMRLEKLLAEQPARDNRRIHEAPRGHMQLENLVATATGRAEPILKQLNLDFPAGEITVIIGPSGSGKSTLARALIGIWPNLEGRVLIDGEPIDSWDRDELGQHVGYLPQDIELFEGSIAENIARFGAIDSNKIIEAAQRAGVHEMILRFPQGYDTPMGIAGNMLSGGQRQRIGLARAMYDNPSLIVLDEPNSNLDDVGEAALIKAIQDLKQQGRTIFLITHRMGIVGIADRILIMNNGQIQNYGARQDVLAALQPPPQAAAPAPDAAAQPA